MSEVFPCIHITNSKLDAVSNKLCHWKCNLIVYMCAVECVSVWTDIWLQFAKAIISHKLCSAFIIFALEFRYGCLTGKRILCSKFIQTNESLKYFGDVTPQVVKGHGVSSQRPLNWVKTLNTNIVKHWAIWWRVEGHLIHSHAHLMKHTAAISTSYEQQ